MLFDRVAGHRLRFWEQPASRGGIQGALLVGAGSPGEEDPQAVGEDTVGLLAVGLLATLYHNKHPGRARAVTLGQNTMVPPPR